MNRIKQVVGTSLAWASFIAFMLLGITLFSMRSPTLSTSLAQATVTPGGILPSSTPSPRPITSTLPATSIPIITPSIKPSATLTPVATATPVSVSTATPTLGVTSTPGGFDARRIKLGALTQVTNDDKFNPNPTSPLDELLNYPVVRPWSPDSTRFLFRKMRTFNNNGQWVSTTDLYVAPINGAPYLLVNNASEASWAPDGSRIVYGLSRDKKNLETGGDTYVVEANGQNPRLIASSVSLNHRAIFLPNGTLALNRSGRVTIVNQQGVPIRDVPNVAVLSDGIGGFLFAPDGKQLAFITSSREPSLKLANAQSGEVVTLPGFMSNLEAMVAWSPDSKYLAYITTSPNELYVVSANGQNPRRLIALDTLPQLGMGSPSWTPDGRVIFFGIRKGNPPYDVVIQAINVDGSASVQILEGAWPFKMSLNGRQLLLTKSPGNLWLAEVISQ